MIHPTKGVPVSETSQSDRVAGGALQPGLSCGNPRLKRSVGDATGEIPELDRSVMAAREHRPSIRGDGDVRHEVGVLAEGAHLLFRWPSPRASALRHGCPRSSLAVRGNSEADVPNSQARKQLNAFAQSWDGESRRAGTASALRSPGASPWRGEKLGLTGPIRDSRSSLFCCAPWPEESARARRRFSRRAAVSYSPACERRVCAVAPWLFFSRGCGGIV